MLIIRLAKAASGSRTASLGSYAADGVVGSSSGTGAASEDFSRRTGRLRGDPARDLVLVDEDSG
ncbi:MAG: hypothetical protein PHE55_10180 [Methylococcaceae bacterium]|nr:hypothetical protein [Methylococcaceae bacterium]